MAGHLDGTVLITGASSGIGEEMVRQLAGRSARLVLVARRAERLAALAASCRERAPGTEIRIEVCDLSDRDALDAMVARLEDWPIDVLINNAGLGDIGLFESSDHDKNERMIAVNVTALVRLTRHLLPGMVARGRGAVLNVSSGFGLTWMPGFAAYVGTKHFVTGFTESLRAEVGSAGVVVTQSCPGPVATEFEAQAESRLESALPEAMTMSAEACVRQSLAALESGRAIVYPGWLYGVSMRLVELLPRWLIRMAIQPLGSQVRRQSRR